jgi:hypothetical protein
MEHNEFETALNGAKTGERTLPVSVTILILTALLAVLTGNAESVDIDVSRVFEKGVCVTMPCDECSANLQKVLIASSEPSCHQLSCVLKSLTSTPYLHGQSW